MPSPSEATVPAFRLRIGDRLPKHGEQSTVARPPIISADGTMATIVVSVGPHHAARLVRVPVDQSVTVRRLGAGHRKFVRKTRTAKSSGAQVLVLDLLHPDSDIQPLHDARYATLCVPHHSIRFHKSVSTAEAIASHPEEWCDPCAAISRERATIRVHGHGTARKLS